MRRWAIGADLADGQRDLVGGQRHRLRVEIAARDDRPIGEQERVVGHGVGLDFQRARHRAQHVQARAVHLRLAADAIRVLHAVVAHAVALADGRAFQQPPQRRRRVDLALVAAQGMDFRPERRGRTHGGIGRERAGDRAPPAWPDGRGTSPASASAVETWVPLMSASPSLAANTSGSSPACASAARPARRSPAEERLALAHHHRAQVRQRREVAGRADASLSPG